MKFALILAALPLAACNLATGGSGEAVQPSGRGDTRSFEIAGFTAVSLRGPDDVEVRTGDFSVMAEGDSALLDRLEIEKQGDTLRIGRKNGGWLWNGGEGVRIVVTMPKLHAASIAGSGDLRAARGEGAFDGSIAGSGNLTLDDMQADTATLSIAGSGDLRIAGGAAGEIAATIAGSGDIDAAGMKAARGTISVAGSGNVRARISDRADVSIVGSGDVEVTGGGKCTVSTKGSGEVRCG